MSTIYDMKANRAKPKPKGKSKPQKILDKVSTNIDEIVKNAVDHVQGWREDQE